MATRILHKIKVKILTSLGLALDIHSKGQWPSCALSNFYHNSFVLDGVKCSSMEGFVQGLKCSDKNEQLQVCNMQGKEAKQFGQKIKGNPLYDIETNGIFWNGSQIDRHSESFQKLMRRAYKAMFDQCPEFIEALKATGAKRLFHTIGNPNPHKTILTEKELCDILTELRLKTGSFSN